MGLKSGDLRFLAQIIMTKLSTQAKNEEVYCCVAATN